MASGVPPLPLGSPRRTPRAMHARANESPHAAASAGATCTVTARASGCTSASVAAADRASAITDVAPIDASAAHG